MLIQSPALHIPQESGFLDKLRSEQEEYGDFTEPRQRWFFIRDLQHNQANARTRTFPKFNLSPMEAERAIAEAAPTDFAGASAALFTASAQKQGKSRWGDKTPRYIHHLDWLAQAFPEAQFVQIIRDGRDVAASMQEAGFAPSIREGAQKWNRRVRTGRDASQLLGEERYYELFYEDLVRRPEQTLQKLCAWLDLPYTPTMLAFHQESESRTPDAYAHLHEKTKQPIDPSRASAWKRTMPTWEIADVEDVAGDLLDELGYELTGVRVPLWIRTARSLRKMVKPLVQWGKPHLVRLGSH